MSSFLRLAVVVTLAGCAAAPADLGPPNVLLIIADDQGYADMSCAGFADDVSTPNLDALAKRGVRFTNAYSTSPICNASRAGLTTGCYQQRFGTFWYGGKGIHDAAFPTLAETMRASGYRTGYVGKFHYGSHKTAKPGNRNFPLEHGFESFYGFHGGRKHYLHHEAALENAFLASRKRHNKKGQSLEQGPMWDGEELRDQQGMSTELFGTRAREFLDAHRDEPFFLQLAFNAVHNFTHQLPKEYLEKHGLQGYRDWDPAAEDYYDWYRAGRKPNNPEGRAHYLGQLEYLDIEVGKVLAHLDALGLRDNTIVVYIGDNGGSTPIYANNGPLRGSKYTLYEGGIRVPLIVSWPARWERDVVRSNRVSAMDILPTICRATGSTLPKQVDGQDIGALLRGDDASIRHDTLYWDTNHEFAVCHGKWKLRVAKRDRHAQHEMVELELGTHLYDMETDEAERENLAARHPEIVQQLVKMHDTWRAAIDG